MIKKIYKKIYNLILDIPNIINAIIFESNKHPWRIIINFFFCTVKYRISSVRKSFNKYFKVTDYGINSKNIHFSLFNIIINRELYENNNFIYGIQSIYFDIVYPMIVKYPIKIVSIEGPYEISQVKIKSGDYVLDCGANVGFFSLKYSNNVGDNGKIFAFEPIPDSLKIFRDSINFNNIKNVIIFDFAVGNSNEDIEFGYEPFDLGNSSSTTKGMRVIVKQTKIDDFVIKNKIEKIDFIKMDIEGSERFAIEGARETIKKFKPKLSICTYHLPDDPTTIRKIILDIRPDYTIIQNKFKLFAY